MSKVFITRTIPGPAPETLAAAGHEVEIWPGELPPPREALAQRLATADAVMTMVTDRIDAELMASAPRLRVISNMAVGYDNVAPSDADAAGIWLTNTPGVLADTTADLAFGLLMAAARNIPQSERDTRVGGWKTWSPTGWLGLDVHGATLGIVGLGEIGTVMARRARGFEMRVLYASRTARPEAEVMLGVQRASLEDLLRASDFVSIHTPLTPETRRFIGAPEFALMQSHAILINTARGGVIDQDALVEALRSGTIGGAALDVMEPEPLPLDHPLYSFPNVVLTPHIGSASHATRQRMASMAAANILAVLAGQPPPSAVNRPRQPKSLS